jgi:ferredoxin-NADP reductase
MAELKLLSTRDETGNIRTFIFETGGATWQAGQYQTYVLAAAGDTKDDNQHFFTIASAPSEGVIHISTRVSDSKFKQALNGLQPGDTIEAHGIEGDFTWGNDEPVVLVAGGIGVTPYRGMLQERHTQAKPLNAVLVHFNRDEQIPFKGEFETLAQAHPELQLRYVTGQPITADSILEHAPEAKRHTTYLSGPEPMVDAVGEELQKRGVTLKQDWFPGYTDQTM